MPRSTLGGMTKSDVAPQLLEGAVALVTGGGSGIGAAVARALPGMAD